MDDRHEPVLNGQAPGSEMRTKGVIPKVIALDRMDLLRNCSEGDPFEKRYNASQGKTTPRCKSQNSVRIDTNVLRHRSSQM
jgi:hypothetical protein